MWVLRIWCMLETADEAFSPLRFADDELSNESSCWLFWLPVSSRIHPHIDPHLPWEHRLDRIDK